MPSRNYLIKKEWFYNHDNEKTKLNWFLYEFASEYHFQLVRYAPLKRFLRRNTPENIARFCEYFSKRMEKSIYDRLGKLTDATVIDEDYITDFYSKKHYSLSERREIGLLLDVAVSAWDQVLSDCEICPQRCISEKTLMSPFFDDDDYN
jgi:hypothetical protein